MEKTHVNDVYDEIAEHFDDTRFSIWDMVRNFLENKADLKGLDVGCGNGKNMLYPKNMVGVEKCKKLVDICRNKQLNVAEGDCCELSFEDNSFDYLICIAVFHHLDSIERRKKAIEEFNRVVKPGGKVLVSVWSYENQEAKRNFHPGDNLVPWRRQKDKKIFKRYYHIFSEKMIRSYFANAEKIYNERGNWVVELKV